MNDEQEQFLDGEMFSRLAVAWKKMNDDNREQLMYIAEGLVRNIDLENEIKRYENIFQKMEQFARGTLQ